MGKTLADLQSNISISAENAVTGTLLWVDNYTGFSDDPAEQSGNYIALKISAEALGEALEGATITATYNGRTTTLNSDQIIIVRQAEGEDTLTFTATKEGYTEGRLTLDLSGLTLEEEPFKFLIHSNNTKVVIDKDGEYLPNGSEVEITGQVPWSFNKNQNNFSITINTKQEIVGEWVGANVRVYYDATSPVVLYSGSMSLVPPATIGTLTFTLPITAAAITNGTIYFEITELDDQSQVVNTYSVEADISNLTLKAGPQINITSNGTNLVIAPSTYSITKTATGTIPNTSDTDTRGLLALKLSYSNIPTYSRYILILRDENQNNISVEGNLKTLPTSLPVYIDSNKIGRAGNKIIFTIRDGNDQRTLATAELDVSQLSIAHSQFNITSNTTGITVSPSTYSVSKTMTGQVPYDTTSSSNKLTLTIDLLNEVASSKYYFVQIRSGNSSGTVLAGGNKTFPTSVEITLDSTNVTNGLYIMVGTRGSATGSVIGIETITIDTSALTLEAAPTPTEGFNVTLARPKSGVSISPSTVANNGTLNISGDWGTASGLTTENPIVLTLETNFDVIDNWNYNTDKGDYLDTALFQHWGISIMTHGGIVELTISLNFVQLAEVIKESYPLTIELVHYAQNPDTQEYERAHSLTINLDFNNLNYPTQTAIQDPGTLYVSNSSLNNFKLGGELEIDQSTQQYVLSFSIYTLGANLPNSYDYVIYDNNGQDLTGHFSGNSYSFNDFTPALKATGPFVLKTQRLNEQNQWVDVCAPITIDVSRVTFGAPLYPYTILGTDLNLIHETGIPTGNGEWWASDSMRKVTLNSSGSSHIGTSSSPYTMDAEVILTSNPGTNTWFIGFEDTTDTITKVTVDSNSEPGTAYIGSGGRSVIGFVPTSATLPATVKLTYTKSDGGTKHITCNVIALQY